MEPPAAPEPLVCVARLGSGSRAREDSLVLSAEQIPHQLRRSDEGIGLWVASSDRERAELALDGYRSDLRSRGRRPRAPALEYGRSRAGIALALALPLMHAAERASGLPWRDLGAANAREILRGELWRTLTALCLHADAAHVAGNAVALGLFATLLFRSLGPGLGAFAALWAGALANALNAALRGPGHVSVGASTAVFACVGLLAGLQFARHWRGALRRGRAWLPIGAGIALLAMLGTGGERTDLGAHALGLGCGVGLGAVAGFCLRSPPAAVTQSVLGFAALGTLAGAWVCAWAFGR